MIIIKVRILTEKEIEEEEEKHSGIWIKGIEYFDVKKLGEWLPWKEWNIRKYIRTGRIRGRKIKGKWYVSWEDLYKFWGGK